MIRSRPYRMGMSTLAAVGALLMAGQQARAWCLLSFSWSSGVVRMAYNFPPSGRLLNGTDSWGPNAEWAMEQWSGITDGLRFVSEGPGSAGDDGSDGVNNMLFANTIDGDPFGRNVVALTFTRTDADGNALEGDIIFNAQVAWDAYNGPIRLTADGAPVFDFRRVALHELGHVLGLDHPDRTCGQIVEAIMNSRVTDTDELSIDDRNGVSFLYSDGNQPPVADAGRDQIGNGTDPFTLNAAGSYDSDGVIAAYEWRLGNEIISVNPLTAVRLNFGAHAVTLTVTDDDGAAAMDSAVIEVGLLSPSGDPDNHPPVADAGMDVKIESGELVILDASASYDDDGNVERFIWSEGGVVLGRDRFTPIALAVGTHIVRLTVFDDDGATDSDTIGVTVVFGDAVDDGPIVESTPTPGPAMPLGCGAFGLIGLAAAVAAPSVLFVSRSRGLRNKCRIAPACHATVERPCCRRH